MKHVQFLSILHFDFVSIFDKPESIKHYHMYCVLQQTECFLLSWFPIVMRTFLRVINRDLDEHRMETLLFALGRARLTLYCWSTCNLMLCDSQSVNDLEKRKYIFSHFCQSFELSWANHLRCNSPKNGIIRKCNLSSTTCIFKVFQNFASFSHKICSKSVPWNFTLLSSSSSK